MNICGNQVLSVLSEALDCVEKEVLGVTDYHAKRVAWLCIQMGRKAGMSEEEIADLAVAALFHDNALNEYKQDYEHGQLRYGADGRKHCIAGENNLKLILKKEVQLRSFVLYHHERADGRGPFGKGVAQVPLGAQFVHIADEVDLQFALGRADEDSLERIHDYIMDETDYNFSKEAAETLLAVVSDEALHTLADCNIEHLALEYAPITMEATYGLAELFARIIDYKSPFTKVHSIGVAEKAKHLAECLGYKTEHIEKMYLAGALHDIGKLLVDIEVLEKPGRLDEQEYKHIQSHAYETYRLLSKIDGFEEVRDWASYHHEKLNGKGYPFGLEASEMSEEARILACVDIYQALTEDRPYKAGMSHKKAIGILKELGEKGELDEAIVTLMDSEFSDGSSDAQTDARTAVVALFQCGVCGYVYEGDAVPYEFICPVCGQPGHGFIRIK